ncbi:MAG: hypothetical protein ACR2H1_13005, partial [Limisphaerales bacterium]
SRPKKIKLMRSGRRSWRENYKMKTDSPILEATIYCPSCQQKIEMPKAELDSYKFKTLECPGCQNHFYPFGDYTKTWSRKTEAESSGPKFWAAILIRLIFVVSLCGVIALFMDVTVGLIILGGTITLWFFYILLLMLDALLCIDKSLK